MLGLLRMYTRIFQSLNFGPPKPNFTVDKQLSRASAEGNMRNPNAPRHRLLPALTTSIRNALPYVRLKPSVKQKPTLSLTPMSASIVALASPSALLTPSLQTPMFQKAKRLGLTATPKNPSMPRSPKAILLSSLTEFPHYTDMNQPS